jgi:hypothetical protein
MIKFELFAKKARGGIFLLIEIFKLEQTGVNYRTLCTVITGFQMKIGVSTLNCDP